MVVAAHTGSGIAVDVLLGLAIASAFVCVLGVVVMRTTFDRLHYAAAASTVPAFCVLAAVILREHVSTAGMDAIAAVGLLFLLTPVLLTATARAARQIDYGDISPRPEEIVEEEEE
jgi:monovalent cation/proton antiporter MnhG/PhaG subunit